MINFFNRGVDSGFAAPTMGHMSALKEPTNSDLMQAILRLQSEIVELRLDIKAKDAKVDKLTYELRSQALGQTEEIYAFMEAQKTDFIESMQKTKESFREEIKFTNALESEERRVMRFDLHKLSKRASKPEKAILPT